MSNVDVSFVIPAFNCEAVVERAIRSISHQGLESYEIVVVNDCSTDDTLTVLKSLAQNDERILLVSHDVNRNLGAARNTGIEACVGEFVYFLDSDDWLEASGVGEMHGIAIARSLDVVAGGVQTVSAEGVVDLYHSWNFESTGGMKGVDLFSHYKIGSIVWNKLYRKSFLDEHCIRFVEGYYHEDIIFTSHIALECKRYLSIGRVVINYFQSASSICNSVPTIKHLSSYLNLYLSMSSYFEILTARGINDPVLIHRLSRNYGFAEVLPKLQRYAATRPRSVFVKDVFEVVQQRMGPAGIGVADFVCGSFEHYALKG